jgi:hypothetical protein
MTLELRSIQWPADKEFDDAIRALGKAAVGDNVPPLRYNRDQVYELAGDVAEAYQTGLVDENLHVAVRVLVGSVLRENAPREPYSDEVYEAARNVAEAYETACSNAFCFYRLTDVYDYEAEIERRRQIGLTIDPAIAETKIWRADSNDPYRILGVDYHGNDGMRLEYFARNPGAGDDEWVHFHHLPIATRKALWQLDKRLADLDEYHAQLKWRQHVGLSIVADTAETAWREADLFDPYGLLDEEYQFGTKAFSYFARNPGGTWVAVSDLPEETCDDLPWVAFDDTVEPHTC